MNYTINQTEKIIEYNGELFFIPKKEFELFLFFTLNKNKLLTREDLLTNIWEKEVVVTQRTIDVHIRKLRKKFPNIPIITRKCYGYMWKE